MVKLQRMKNIFFFCLVVCVVSCSPPPLSCPVEALGGTVQIEPVFNVPGPIMPIVSWRGFETCSITISLVSHFPLSAAEMFFPVGRVTWTLDGVSYEIDVDIISAQFTVVGDSVSVGAYLDNSSTAPLSVSGGLAFSSTVSSSRLIRTFNSFLLPGGFVTIVRPPFAVSVIDLERSDFSQAITLRFGLGNSAPLYERVFDSNVFFDSPIPIPNGVQTFTIVNISNVAVRSYLVFGLL